MSDSGLRFLVLDDHALVREGLEHRIRADFDGADIIFSGSNLNDAIASLSERECDCAVVDLDLGDGTPIAEIVSAFSSRGIPVVIVSAMVAPEVLQAALATGAQAFVTKRSNVDDLTTAIRAVLNADTWISPELAGVLLKSSVSVDLSNQEKRALVLYASGLTLNMVARRMNITANTAKDYLDRVRSKYAAAGISARTKLELNQAARSQGLLP